MKKRITVGKLAPVTWDMACPCGDGVPDPDSGSLAWTRDDLDRNDGLIVLCLSGDCWVKVKAPKEKL